ncbi:hypothetical protein KEJ15_02210, partial [Candidatus Bathyarchaeota archaeon]|nr:hypothetical protein [Candidatus Bathyarchaeota archaeon]
EGHDQYFIWEDGLWSVFNKIPCCYTSYSWCNQPPDQWYPCQCSTFIDQHESRFQADLPIFLNWHCPYWTKPITVYIFYDEQNNRTWQEVKCASTHATTR